MTGERSPLEKMSAGEVKPLSIPPRARWLRWAPRWAVVPIGAIMAVGLREAVSHRPWAELSNQQRLTNIALFVAGGLVLMLFRWLIEPREKK